MNQSKEEKIWNDQFIKESVKKNYDQVPKAPLSKEAMWNQINAELAEESPRKLPIFINNKLLSVASIFLILIIGSLFFQIKGGEAFGWFTDYFVQDQGSTTKVTNQLSDESFAEDDPLPPLPDKNDLEVKELIPIEEKMSFSEASEVVSFSLVKPTVVPEGYTLKDVAVITFADHPQEKVILTYGGVGGMFTIRQEPIMGEYFSSNLTVNNKEAKVNTISINGTEASYFGFRDGNAQLVWMRMRTLITIDGPLSENDMKELGASLE